MARQSDRRAPPSAQYDPWDGDEDTIDPWADDTPPGGGYETPVWNDTGESFGPPPGVPGADTGQLYLLQMIDEAIQRNRQAYQQAQEGTWEEEMGYDPATQTWSRPTGKWTKSVDDDALARLDKEYISLLGQRRLAQAAAKTAEEKLPPKPDYGGTTSQYYTEWDPVAKQWVQKVNPNFRPPQGAATSQRPTSLPNARYLIMPDGSIVPNQYYYEEEKARRAPSALPNSPYLVMGDGSIVPNEYYTEDTYERQRQQEQDRYQRQQDAWQRAQQKLAAQMGLTRDMQQSQIQTLPYLARPGQTHVTGGEPGQFFEQYLKGTGVPYNPDQYKAAITQYDPAAMWQQAQDALLDWWQKQQAASEQGGQ